MNDENDNALSVTSSSSGPLVVASQVVDNHDDHDNDVDEWMLECHCSSPKVLVNLLQRLQPASSSTKDNAMNGMTIFANPLQLTIHSHPNPQFQSTLELPASLFDVYKVMANEEEDVVEVCTVSWKTLLDCLGLFIVEPSTTALVWKFHTTQHVLRLESCKGPTILSAAILPALQQSTDEETAELSTAFGSQPFVARLLCPSLLLQDLGELDQVPGATSITLVFQSTTTTTAAAAPQEDDNASTYTTTPSKQHELILSVQGHYSHCQVILPGHHVSLEVMKARVQYSYPLPAWQRALKPLDLSKETCLSINRLGILAIQHQIVLPDHQGAAAFCDCLLLPLVNEDNDNDDDNDATTTTSRLQTQEQPHDNVETFLSSSVVSSSRQRDGRRRHSAPIVAAAAASATTTSKSSTNRRRRHDDEEDNSTIATEKSLSMQQRRTREQSQQQLQQDSDSNDSNEDDDDEPQESSLPRRPLLFGSGTGAGGSSHHHRTLTAATASRNHDPDDSFSSSRGRRYKKQRTAAAAVAKSPPRSPLLLGSDDDHDNDNDEEEEETEDQQPQRPQQQQQRVPPRQQQQQQQEEVLYCSSPEVVYGGDD